MSDEDAEGTGGWTIDGAVRRVAIDDDRAIEAVLHQLGSEGFGLRAAVADGAGQLLMIFSYRWQEIPSIPPITPTPPSLPVPLVPPFPSPPGIVPHAQR